MKNKLLAQKYWNSRQSPMGEIADLATQYDNVIDLSLGDPDYPTDELIIKKAFEDAKAGHTKYTAPLGDLELRKEIVKYNHQEFNYYFDLLELMIVVGACHGMFLVLEAILDEGDEVIIPAPYFTPYLQQVELAGGNSVIIETTEENKFQVELDKLKSTITDKTKAIIINNPNNPTGSCCDWEVLEEIVEIAIDNDLLIITDEVYGSLNFQSSFSPLATIEGAKERTITIASFSKDYAMTGWRVGYVVAPQTIINCIQNINEGICYTASAISQRAGIYALQNRETIQPPMIEEYKKRVFYAYNRIRNIKQMSVLYPQGTFYLFINVKDTGLDSTEVSKEILNQAQVLVIPGTAFGDCGEGYIRIACTVEINQLEAAFNRIEQMSIFN